MEARKILWIIADLLSEEGENVEYDRACAEIATEILGLPMDYRHAVVPLLRAMKEVTT